ncbi:uncharacterized protein LOC110714733 [Chenopodium quinoa]|uniref:Uncharacterized protein n=1 Tax=Chenopodium quinoa TaxID=63459 RepID=A0A803LZE9_CHEQI|nr:uncharacterized protein LOC110714733 [Chenopodium quinoa]
MQFLSRIVSRNSPSYYYSSASILSKHLSEIPNFKLFTNSRSFSNDSENGGGNLPWGDSKVGSDNFQWDESAYSWSTGLTKDHFDGEAVGHQVAHHVPSGGGVGSVSEPRSNSRSSGDSSERLLRKQMAELQREARREARRELDAEDEWDEKMEETSVVLKQITEPGARGSYLKDSEKAEMYRLHKGDPEVYNVERLAKDFRIMRQRVVAILWLKELEEEEEKKLGEPLDDSVELLLDAFPEFFVSHDREFHVASLPYKPDFKVMPEGWDGTTRDPDEVHYEISKKEDDILYEEFLQKFNFNKMKFKNEVKVHKYSRRRPSDGWSFTVEKLGPRGKRGGSGGWKFVSQPDGSTRPLNDIEKMYVKRETPRRRRKILP